MITANEAKDLYNASGAEADRYLLTHVDPVVKSAANSGKRSVFIHFGSYELGYHAKTASDLEKLIMDKLKSFGYMVSWEPSSGLSYVPRGLADDDGNGPKYINYGMTIGW